MLMMLSLSACTTNGPGVDYCTVAKPIYFSREDKVSRRTDEAIITHNETYERLCR